VERIHAARDEGVGFIVFNPAAFTHTSVALRATSWPCAPRWNDCLPVRGNKGKVK